MATFTPSPEQQAIFNAVPTFNVSAVTPVGYAVSIQMTGAYTAADLDTWLSSRGFTPVLPVPYFPLAEALPVPATPACEVTPEQREKAAAQNEAERQAREIASMKNELLTLEQVEYQPTSRGKPHWKTIARIDGQKWYGELWEEHARMIQAAGYTIKRDRDEAQTVDIPVLMGSDRKPASVYSVIGDEYTLIRGKDIAVGMILCDRKEDTRTEEQITSIRVNASYVSIDIVGKPYPLQIYPDLWYVIKKPNTATVPQSPVFVPASDPVVLSASAEV